MSTTTQAKRSARWYSFVGAQVMAWIDVAVGSTFGFLPGCLITLAVGSLVALGAWHGRHEAAK